MTREGEHRFMDPALVLQGRKTILPGALRGSYDPGYLFYTVGKLKEF